VLTINTPALVYNQPTPVAVVNSQPVQSVDYALVVLGGTDILVPISSAGGGSSGTTGSVNADLASTSGAATSIARFQDTNSVTGSNTDTSAALISSLNTSGFQVVATLGAGSAGGAGNAGGNLTPAQMTDPGLFRESAVAHGRFRVIYHEAVVAAMHTLLGNTAGSSSYHAFLATEKPEVILLHAAPGALPPSPDKEKQPAI
jgi:hypothetical protein